MKCNADRSRQGDGVPTVQYQVMSTATMVTSAAGASPPNVFDCVLRIDAARIRSRRRGQRIVYTTSEGTQYTGVFEPETAPGFEGFINAYIEELPGCVSYGRDLATAKANLREALDLYLENDTGDEAHT